MREANIINSQIKNLWGIAKEAQIMKIVLPLTQMSLFDDYLTKSWDFVSLPDQLRESFETLI